MEALFAIDRSGFHTCVSNIALYRKAPPAHWQEVADEAVRLSGGRHTYQVFDVPGLKAMLGKPLPVDVHGRYILMDSEAVGEVAVPESVVKYSMLCGVCRCNRGGRMWYDQKLMNGSLLAGGLLGWGFLNWGQSRWQWMRSRPLLRVGAGLGVGIGASCGIKIMLGSIGLGVGESQRVLKEAIHKMDCGTCVGEVQSFTETQVAEMSAYEVPTTHGGQPIPPAYQDMMRKNNTIQIELMKQTVREMKVAHAQNDGVCKAHKAHQSM